MINPSKDAIEALRSQGMTRAEIASALNISLARVKRLISAYEVEPRKRRKSAPPPVHPAPPERRRVKPFTALSLMEQCAQILGKRLREDHRGYVLDGRPASSQQVINAAGLRLRRST
jgi:hypothetical protein